MNRQGHTGITLLAFAPVAYVLASEGKLLLAVVCWLGIQAVEPLPDQDFRLPGLSHRGVSHSLLSMVVIGSVLGAGGWLLGGYGFELLYSLLSVCVGVWNWILGFLPELSTAIFTGLIPNVPPEELVTTLQRQAGENVSRWSFALFGFTIGAYGVFAHLLGDVITVRGIKPFLPFSNWRLSLTSLRADSPAANSMLFGAGMVAIALVVVATVPAMTLAGPATLSPAGVAAGQSTTQTSQANATDATVSVDNQTTNGSTVTIENVTLPDGGFVALHDSEYLNGRAPADSSIIAVSKYLSPGTHTNVTVEIANAPPGNYPGLNQSRLNTSQPLAVVVYRDSDGNERFDYVRTLGENDTPYTSERALVSDAVGVTVPSSETKRRTASVTVRNQTLRNHTLVVERARLPEGGFVVAHNASYRRTGDPLRSVAGVSEYLSPGNHTNVTLDIPSSALARTQTVTVRPSLDTNGNQRYDFVRSDGFQDIGYTTKDRSTVVAETARVRVPGTDRATGTARPTRSDSSVRSSSSPSAEAPNRSSTEGRATAGVQPNADELNGATGVSGLSGLSGFELLLGAIGVLAVLVALPTLVRNLQ